MKKTGIFLIACATVVLMMLLSCKGRSASRAEAMLEDVVSIYGTPDYSDEPNRSYLPVEIFRKDKAWYAHYVTNSGKPLADTKLDVYCEKGDTTVVHMEEISEGPTGYYILSLDGSGSLRYTSSRGESFDFIPEIKK